LFGVGNGHAGFLDFGQRRRPDIGRVNVAALPGSYDLRRLHVQDAQVARGDIPHLFKPHQQVKVRGGHERGVHAFALQVRSAADA